MEEKKRKERSDKGKPRGCRWAKKYHTIRFRLNEDLYLYALEHKGANISMNQYLNDMLETAFSKQETSC